MCARLALRSLVVVAGAATASITALGPVHAQLCIEGNPAASIGVIPNLVVAFDVDGDGDADAVTANHYSQAPTLTVALNDGTGFVRTPVHYALAETAQHLVAADVDADGDRDLITANKSLGTLSILVDMGGGIFAPQVQVPCGAQPIAIASGDFDADGDLDLAVANGGTTATISLLLNQGGGTWSAPVTIALSAQLSGLATGDFDGDGDLDLLAASGFPNQKKVFVFLNQGAASFALLSETTVANGVAHFFAADMDGDGDLDVVCSGTRITTLSNQGSGTFVAFVDPTSESSPAITPADVDGDGDLDVVASGLRIYLNQGNGTFAQGLHYPFPAKVSNAVDVDLDGDLDFYATLPGGLLGALLNDGHGAFVSTSQHAVGSVPRSMASADVDGDGRRDLIVANYGSDSLTIFTSQPDGSFNDLAGPYVGDTPRSVVAADFDNDGDIDFAVVNRIPDKFSVVINLGGGIYAPPVQHVAGQSPVGIAAADFDGDGDVDLAMVNYSGLRVRFNQGDGTFVPILTTNLQVEAVAIAVGDLDGDFDPDIAIMARNGVVVLVRNQGGGLFATPTVMATTLGNGGFTLADLDDDGDLDLTFASFEGHTVAVHRNNGDGTFGNHVTFPTLWAPNEITSADVDSDGDLDLVMTHASWHVVSSMLNDGNASFDPPRPHPVGNFPVSIHSFDPDGDGDLDIAVVNEVGATMTFLRNCSTSGAAIALGDGTGAACPCGNESAQGTASGCFNTRGVGATLRARGAATLSSDQLVLEAADMPNTTSMYLQGSTEAAGGAGVAFGDGLSVVSGTVVRLATKHNAANGSRYPELGDARVSVRGAVSTSGVRVYQVWYRDPANFCTASAFNWTNGVRVAWRP